MGLTEQLLGSDAHVDTREAEHRITAVTYRLLARGLPLHSHEVAVRAGVPVTDVDRLVDSRSGTRRDSAGRILGFGGLDLEATGHAMTVDAVPLYTWCAWDTFFIPLILGKPAAVTSQSPAGLALRYVVTEDGVTGMTSSDARLSLVNPPEGGCGDVRADFCSQVLLFPDEDAGKNWAGQRDDVTLVSVDDGFRLAREHAAAIAGDLAALAARPRDVITMTIHHDPSTDVRSPGHAEGQLVGQGVGTATGPVVEGSLRWTLHERVGEDVCAMDAFVTITTRDGSDVRAEGQGFARLRDPASSLWEVAGSMRFESDDPRYAWLGEQLGSWEGYADLSKGSGLWRVWLRR